jgi:hypothetical protein
MPIDISRRIFPVKRISFLAMFVAAVALLSTSCGTSDSVKSITLSTNGQSAGGFYNLAGVDGTLQLQVIANYNSGKFVNVTNQSTYKMTPTGWVFASADPAFASGPGSTLPAAAANTVTISPTGLMTGIASICTWEDLIVTTGSGSNQTTGPANPPIWAYTGFYQVVATYKGMSSQPVGVGMGIAESNAPTGGCGPS